MPQKVEIVLSAEGAQAVAQVFKDLAAKGTSFADQVVSGGKRSEQALNSLGRTARDVLTIFTGFSLGSIAVQVAQMAHDSIRELTKMGLENQRVEESFTRMAAAVGVSADALVASLKRTSQGIVDTNATMLASSKALAQGLTSDQLLRIMETARAQATLAGKTVAESYNSIAESVTNLNVRQLREFGIVIDLQKTYENYAASLGTVAAALTETGQRAALMQAIDQQTLKNRAALTQGEITNAQEIEKAKAKWSDFFALQAKGFSESYTAIIKGGAAFLDWSQQQSSWLDKLADQWDRYKARTFWGPGTAFPNADTGRPASAAAMARAGAQDDWMIPPAAIADAAPQIDAVKDALVKVDQAMQQFGLHQAQGTMTAVQFAAGIQDQIARLQALGSNAPDVTAKIVALQTQMATLANVLKTAVAGIADAFRALSDEAGRGVLPVDRITALSAPLDAFRDKLRDQLAVYGLSKDAIQKLDAELARYQDALVSQVQATRDAKQEADEFYANLRDNIDSAAKSIEAMEFSYEKWLASLNANGALDEATAFYANLAENIDAAAKSYESMQDPIDNANRANQALKDTLQSIQVQAQLLGPDFDAVSASISAMTSEMKRLADESNGTVTPAMAALAAKIKEFQDFKDLRDTFQDIFSSVGGAIEKLVTGVIQGTQTMAQAFKNLGQSIVIEFVNRIIQQALNPLVKAAASAVATLLSPAGAGAAIAAAAGSGAVDITGQRNPDQTFVTGGNGFSLSGIPTGAFDFSTLSNIWTGVQNFFGTFSQGLSDGAGLLDSFSGAVDSFMIPFEGAASGLSTALAGVGAAVALFGTLMDFVNGKTSEAIGGVAGGIAGAVGGGLVGAYFGVPVLGALAGGALGDWLGSMLGGLFGNGPSQYDLKRIAASNEANQALGSVAGQYQSALTSGDIAKVLAALQAGGGGAAGNSVRSELVLPTGISNQIGLTGQQIGDQVVTQWKDVTLDQFKQVIAAFKGNPDLIQQIRGSGDVPLLEQGDAQGVADQIKHAAQALLTAFEAMESVRDRISTLGADLVTASAKILPPGLAAKFADSIVGPMRDRMLAVLSSGLGADEMQRQLDALAKELQSFAGLVALYGQLDQDIAQLSGDIATQTRGAVIGITTILDAANKAVSDAQGAAAGAVGTEAQLTAENDLRTAILNRYATEMQLVQQIQAAIGQLVEAGKTVTATLIGLAADDLTRNSRTEFDKLYLSLAHLAMTAPTVVQRLAAIGEGLALIIAATATAPKLYLNTYGAGPTTQSGTSVPDQIVSDMMAGAAPFLGALSDLIDQAKNAHDLAGELGLLQQQADVIKQLGQAAVDAVNQWRGAAIQAAQDAASAYISGIQDAAARQTKAIQDAADAHVGALQTELAGFNAAVKAIQDGIADQIKSLNGQVKTLQDQAQAEQAVIAARVDGLNAEQDAIQQRSQALQEELAAVKEWEGVVKSTTDFIQQLRQGPLSQANPADKLRLAQGSFDTALQAFRAHPTAAGAGDLQQLAQTLLQSGAAVFTEPSPKYQALFQSVVKAMQEIKATAAGQAGPVSSADLAAQTAALTAQSKAIADEIKTLQAQSKTIGDQASAATEALRNQIQALQDQSQNIADIADAHAKDLQGQIDDTQRIAKDQIDAINDATTKQIQAIRDTLADQITAINAAADATIAGINQGMATALRANADRQNAILGLLEGAQIDQLNAITGGQPIQQYMAQKAKETADLLTQIRDNLATILSGGVPQHADGSMYTKAGLAFLHPGEIVIPRRPADVIRSGGGFGGVGGTLTVNINVSGVDAKDSAAIATVIKREVVPVIEREMRGGTLGRITVERVRGR